MHQSSGRWKIGLLLTLITSILWGTLPIALKGLLQDMDAISISWYRFFVAALITGLFLIRKRTLPKITLIKSKKIIVLFIIVAVGLVANYLFYLMGLDWVTPSAAQVVIQLAPLFLLLGGLIIFKEKFNTQQWIGSVIFFTGLLLFFNHRMDTLFSGQSHYFWGIILIIIAAITWAAYALAQKQLLMDYSSQQIMFVVYLAGGLFLIPGVHFSSLTQLSTLQWWLLIYCCLNTLIAYGSFAEALEHWEASRVSAMLSITPLLTIIFAYITHHFFPSYIEIESLNWLSLLGGMILVAGASIAALSGKK